MISYTERIHIGRDTISIFSSADKNRGYGDKSCHKNWLFCLDISRCRMFGTEDNIIWKNCTLQCF